jgi:pyruvate,water dikinase
VVEEGGLLSHAAVIARELGLTAVIGASGAMATVPDGALVEVDPGAGRVRVLAPAG